MVVLEWQAVSDEEVIDRVRAGETGLYELLMRRYNQRLYRLIRSVVRNETEAEDILQEAWVRAYEHLDQFAGRSSFATWVSQIAFHEALSRARKGKRWTSLEDSEGEIIHEVDRPRPTDETPEASAIRNQLAGILEAALDALPETYRAVFVLREVEQLSTMETAGCLGLTEEAVKTRLFRSRALLRRELGERMGEAATAAYAFLGERCDRTVARVLARIGA